MADRPKKKTGGAARNADRRNGKAPKKHPKTPDVKQLTPEERAERDRRAAERRVEADKQRAKLEAQLERSRRARINRLHEQALALNRAFNDTRRREMSKPAADAIKRMVGIQ